MVYIHTINKSTDCVCVQIVLPISDELTKQSAKIHEFSQRYFFYSDKKFIKKI